MPIPREVAELCEDPQSNSPQWHTAELHRHEHFDVWLGPRIYPGLTVVMRLRAGGVPAKDLLDDARAVLREHARTRAIWMIGSSTTPSDLPEQLLALGLHDDVDPLLHGVVLSREPDRREDRSIEVVRADEREQYRAFLTIQREAFGEERSTSGGDEFVDELYDSERGADHVTTYLAYVDGDPVATARATFADVGVVLNGGATLQRARGRGVYRALVAARWDDAVERGTPYLTTLARPTSYPILKRVGFEDACQVRVLNDGF